MAENADNSRNNDRKPSPQVSQRNTFGFPSAPESSATPNMPLATRSNGKAGSHK